MAWAIRSKKKIVIRSNNLGYLFEKRMSSIWMASDICSKKLIAIHSNGLGYPFEKNCYLFERLGLSIRKRNCPPFERPKLSVQR